MKKGEKIPVSLSRRAIKKLIKKNAEDQQIQDDLKQALKNEDTRRLPNPRQFFFPLFSYTSTTSPSVGTNVLICN